MFPKLQEDLEFAMFHPGVFHTCFDCARGKRGGDCSDMKNKTGYNRDGKSFLGDCWRPEGVALAWNEVEEK